MRRENGHEERRKREPKTDERDTNRYADGETCVYILYCLCFCFCLSLACSLPCLSLHRARLVPSVVLVDENRIQSIRYMYVYKRSKIVESSRDRQTNTQAGGGEVRFTFNGRGGGAEREWKQKEKDRQTNAQDP